jgi:hypothetical protein
MLEAERRALFGFNSLIINWTRAGIPLVNKQSCADSALRVWWLSLQKILDSVNRTLLSENIVGKLNL